MKPTMWDGRMLEELDRERQALEGTMSTPNCEKCYDVGEILPSGPSDAPVTFCECSMGKFLKRRIAEEVAVEREAWLALANRWLKFLGSGRRGTTSPLYEDTNAAIRARSNKPLDDRPATAPAQSERDPK